MGNQVWMWQLLDPILNIPLYIPYIFLLDRDLKPICVVHLCYLRTGFLHRNDILSSSCQLWCLIYDINGVFRFCVLWGLKSYKTFPFVALN